MDFTLVAIEYLTKFKSRLSCKRKEVHSSENELLFS